MVTRKRMIANPVFICVMVTIIAAGLALVTLAATQTDIVGPLGSGRFGQTVTVLPNGNIVVTDPFYDAPGPIADAGAVYLYDGATGALISRLAGSQANDMVGSGGVVTLTNGNYVVSSPEWDNGAATDAGAVTWGNGTTGITGVVTVANSLVGSMAHNGVGSGGVTALSNGNYVVLSSDWDNGTAADAGAVTWGNGATGITGVVTVTNSLVGGAAGDDVGSDGVTALTNGNYVVSSSGWDNGVAWDAGAVTWGNGATGITGVVARTNSLVGSTAEDFVGGVTALTNGNYVVRSPNWDKGAATNAGAVTWGNGTTGITGAVTLTNSLVGAAAYDYIGDVTALSNGNYVVHSPYWDNGAATDAGAATWGNGTTGITGVVTRTNSLVGSTTNDYVGNYGGVTALTNGNYVVLCPYWDNGTAADAGAVTWGNGTTGITGAVTLTNSLVGSTAGDHVGIYGGVTALTNGNYVVSSHDWDNGAAADAGAVTWGNGATGITGVVTRTNSLVGGAAGDNVGYGAAALSNGNYVVLSWNWDNGSTANAGAATWGNGATGITGVVTITNSLVGSTTNDNVGGGVTALTNGNYVVFSTLWDNGSATDAGAVTWGNGTTGITGVVTVTNSLVGSTSSDSVGSYDVTALTNGNYVVLSPGWDNGTTADAGAVTLGDGNTGTTTGPVTADNSVRGTAASGGSSLNFGYDYAHDQLVVGRPADNIVTLFVVYPNRIYLPVVIKSG